eukprot:COSAG01_NODE_2067_length_8506_cov_221.825384_12_plen_138_part_00
MCACRITCSRSPRAKAHQNRIRTPSDDCRAGCSCWGSWSHAARTYLLDLPALVVRSSHHQPQKHMRGVTEGADGRADSTGRQYLAGSTCSRVQHGGMEAHAARGLHGGCARLLQRSEPMSLLGPHTHPPLLEGSKAG